MAGSGAGCVELHMAKTMEELNKKTTAANFDCSTPKLLGRSSNKLFLAAKDAAFQKDEEKAYVLFMRFMELVKRVRSSKEYKTRKAEYDSLIPVRKIQTALSEAERLSESLRERYSTPQGKRQKLDSVDHQGEGVADQEVPNDANVDHDKPMSAEELYKRNSSMALVPQQFSATNTDTKATENGFTEDPHSMLITTQDLFSLLKSSPDDVIVLDCRPRSMFLASHPDSKKYPQWLSVPEELITKGITCESLAKFLRGKERKMWADRAKKLAIVLVDCGSTVSELSDDHSGLPLVQLRDAIHKYDTTVELSRPPVFLEGGYTQWYLHYSPLCVGVWRWEGGGGGGGGRREGGREEGGSERNIEEFDYPTFPDISDIIVEPEKKGEKEEVEEEEEGEATNGPTSLPLVPSAPPTFTNHTPLPHPPAASPTLHQPPRANPDHTPLPHPPLPTPVYEPPPVMTILSLDDLNLDQDDSAIQLSTIPDNRVMNGQPAAPTVQATHMQGHRGVGQPVLQTGQPGLQTVQHVQYVPGQETVPPVPMAHQHPQMGQQFGTHQEMRQDTPHIVHPHTGHAYPPTGQPGQFSGQQIGQFHPQMGHPAHPTMVQQQPNIVQPDGPHNYQTGHPSQQFGHPVSMQMAPQLQPHQQIAQPAPQSGQLHPQAGQHTALQMQPHPQIAQPAPHLGQLHPQTGQHTAPQLGQHNPQIVPQPPPDSVPNQRVVYGPIPNPPGYDQAVQLPSQPPVQPPIPPPVSLPPPPPPHTHPHSQSNFHNQSGQFHNQFQNQQQQQHIHHSNQNYGIIADTSTAGQQGVGVVYYQDGGNPVNPAHNRFQDQSQAATQQPPSQQSSHVNIDPSAAKIQELERILELREREEQARNEREEREKAELEREKQRWELDRLREAQELEQQRQALAQEAAVLTKSKGELEKMRVKVEEERKNYVKESEQLRQLLQVQQSGQKDQRAFTVNQGLPTGWDKKLDRTTGRFYYVDHNSKTTHWNPPGNWLDYQAQLQQRARGGGQAPGGPGQISGGPPQQQQRQQHGVGGAVKPGGPGQISGGPPQKQPQGVQGPQLRTANQNLQPKIPPTQTPKQPNRKLPPGTEVTSSPSHPKTGQPVAKQASVPSVDRSNKPQISPSTPTIDRSTKPSMSPAQHRRKMNALQPMYGSQGYGLTGLRNLGNTCFMNSTLQCLCSTAPFVSHFLQGVYMKDRNRSNPLGHGGVLADEFSFLMKTMWSGQYRFVSPRDFKDAISQFAPTFSGTQQHDSQEFLAFLLDGLHEDMNRVKERRYIENPDYSILQDSEAARIAWTLHKKRNDSIIVDLFQGQFRSTLRCLTCQHRSVNFEAFMYLSVPLPANNNPCSLKECIKLFTKEERVTGRDKWYCSSCKQHRDASKRIEIWKLPVILLIHLKRFSYDGVWRQKKQNFVDFPFTGLDMSADVVGERAGKRDYRLFGVSNHFGTLTGGHYTACCFNPYKKKFYNFDDHEIREVQQRQVQSSAAYLLFYSSLELSAPKTF